MKTLSIISAADLDLTWPKISHMIAAGLACGEGELTTEQVRLLIVQGRVCLLVSRNENRVVAALAGEILGYPNYRVLNIISMGGDHLGLDLEDVRQLVEICKALKVSKLQGFTHPKLTELLKQRGFHKAYDLVRLDIGDWDAA